MKLMIADDEPIVRSGIRHTIDWEKDGITIVAEASDGVEAFKKAMQHVPDIIICDIRMPRMDGLSFVKQLHSLLPETHMIILTAFAEKEYMLEAIRCGVFDFLLKPAGFDVIRQAVLKARDDILSQFHTQNLLEQRSNLLEEDALLFHEHYIRALLNNSEKPQKIREAIQLLKIPVKGPYYTIALAKALPTKEWMLSQSLSGMLATWSPMMVRMNTGFHVLVLNLSKASEVEEVYQCLLKKTSEVDLPMLYPMVISDAADSIEALHKRWRQAEQARSRCPWKETKRILYAREITHTPLTADQLQSLTANVVNKLSKCARPKLSQTLLGCFDELAEQSLSADEMMSVLESASQQLVALNGYHIPTNGLSQLSFAECRNRFVQEESVGCRGVCLPASGHEGRALRYIEQHYGETLSLENVAQALYLSPTYLSRILNEKTERGFIGWLRFFRIEKAKELLQSTELKNYEVAERVGYNSYKVFSEHFWEETGCTISQWKDDMKKEE